VNDVSAAVVNGKTYVAVATDGGVSVINETDGTVFDAVQTATNNNVNRVVITPQGRLYYTAQQDNTETAYFSLNKHNSLPTADLSAVTASSYASKYWAISGTTPALAISTGYFDMLNFIVLPNQSSVDPDSDLIAVASANGLIVINDKQGDETNGSVKYYTKDYISEEMVGDIRTMLPLDGVGGRSGLVDVSVQARNVTNNNTTTFTRSGVRGHAANFVSGSSMSLAGADDADYTFTTLFSAGAWAYRDIDSGAAEGILGKLDSAVAADRSFAMYLDASDLINCRTDTAGPTAVTSTGPAVAVGGWHHFVVTYDGANQRCYLDGVQVDADAQTGSMQDSAESFIVGNYLSSANTPGAGTFWDGAIDEVMLTAETLTPTQIKRMYETGKRALEGGTEGVASSATSAHSAFRIGVAAGAVKYTAGQFIGSIIQVYDGPGGATSTRFITQTASSTSDYYIQFSPDHSASIANSDTFSIGPNALQGDSNRVTAVAVDDLKDFIYIGSTSATGSGGMVTKIALDSDTVTDVWHPSVGKLDDASLPYNTASTTAISLAGTTLAIGANDSSNGGLWSESIQETLDHKLNGPKSVFTVIDNIQTPKITTVSGLLTISTATSTSLTIGTAATTGSTIQIKAGPGQNLLLSGDS
ncbi:MAG: LamG domain-containing protein, partial [Patescibacteria group bacterium]